MIKFYMDKHDNTIFLRIFVNYIIVLCVCVPCHNNLSLPKMLGRVNLRRTFKINTSFYTAIGHLAVVTERPTVH